MHFLNPFTRLTFAFLIAILLLFSVSSTHAWPWTKAEQQGQTPAQAEKNPFEGKAFVTDGLAGYSGSAALPPIFACYMFNSDTAVVKESVKPLWLTPDNGTYEVDPGIRTSW